MRLLQQRRNARQGVAVIRQYDSRRINKNSLPSLLSMRLFVSSAKRNEIPSPSSSKIKTESRNGPEAEEEKKKKEKEKEKCHQEKVWKISETSFIGSLSPPAAVPRTKARTGYLLSRHGSGSLLRIIDPS